MKISILKTNIISFSFKTNFYYFSGDLIVQNDCVKDLGVMLDSKLHFHRQVSDLHSQTLMLLEPIYLIMNDFLSLDSLKVVYIT
jgi:hypothetical protein